MNMPKRLWPLLLCLLLLCPAALGAEDTSDEPSADPPEEQVFVIEGDTLMQYTGHDPFVTIPAEAVRIDGGAFSAAPFIRDVVLHSAILSIDVGVFANCSEVTLSLVEGTVAHDYAVEYNLPYTPYADDASLPQPPEVSDTHSEPPPTETPAPATETPESAAPAPGPEPTGSPLRGFFSDMTSDKWITLGVAAAELVLLALLVLVIVSALRSRGKKEKK